jgi:hypothetical protein
LGQVEAVLDSTPRQDLLDHIDRSPLRRKSG